MTRNRLSFLAAAAATTAASLLAVTACQPVGDQGAPPPTEYPRDETVFTTGNEWGTFSDWNPLSAGPATYVQYGIYEPLFVFDPWKTRLEPWLAEGGEWVSDKVFLLTLRKGVRWQDGKALTADDVVFTFDLRFEEGVQYANLTGWLDEVVAEDEHTVRFRFSDPRRGEWDNNLYTRLILPEHRWSDLVASGDADGDGADGDGADSDGADSDGAEADKSPGVALVTGDDRIVGTGPLRHVGHSETRAVYERNDDWWATEQLDLEIQPRYVIDFRNASNEVVVPQLLTGDIDVSNNFITGVQNLDGYGETITTFYPEDPYMIPANTAVLIPNHQREPMDDTAFRRALAFSIDVQTIVDTVYQNIVQPAHVTGLLDIWKDTFDPAVEAEYGFSYDPDQARQILDQAGYQDLDGDGFVEEPDGDPIELTLIVPVGWTDWNEAAEVIAASARGAGINVVTDFPDNDELTLLRDSGEFDLLINNNSGLSNTPATYYTYVFRLPIRKQQPTDNFGRYQNQEAWDLTEQLWRLSLDEPGFQETISRLQEIAMAEMPVIPMWYNGLWSQVNNSVWTNWPSASEQTPDYYPNTWGGTGGFKSLLMFTGIEPAG
jgi:peptide/nickel transport system substrate-binding protein